MIECKAISLTSQALQQVLGYNMFVGALYVAVVSKKEVLFLDGTQESNCMPSYEQLKKGIK
ncbi:MAG: hypothetical protein LVR00_04480 [Rhabdochlamydiaceae bacterium]|jgi:hypothetical protein